LAAIRAGRLSAPESDAEKAFGAAVKYRYKLMKSLRICFLTPIINPAAPIVSTAVFKRARAP
jgi:hypothetical protein